MFLPPFSTQLEIMPEDSQAGILISPFDIIHIKESTKYLSYTFDVSSVQYILNWYSKLKTICGQGASIIAPLDREIKNIQWNTYKPFYYEQNITNINITLFHNAIIDANIQAFNLSDDEDSECLHLTKIVQNFAQMNKILNALSKSNTTVLDEIISLEHLFMDVKTLLRGSLNNNYIYPFDFSNMFAVKFFKYNKFHFFYSNYTVILMFEIPTFKTVNLYKIDPKPIIFQSIPHVLQTEQKYLATLNNRYIFFNDFSYETSCFLTPNNRFCIAPSNNWDCEIDVMNKIYSNSNCFRKLKQQNIITQINENTYFTIFDPLFIKVKCGNSDFSIKLTSNMKIINNKQCSLNTTFFEYTQLSPKNGIFISDDKDSHSFWTSDFKQTNIELYLNISYLLIFIIFCIASIAVTIFYKEKQIETKIARRRVQVRVSKIFEPYLRNDDL